VKAIVNERAAVEPSGGHPQEINLCLAVTTGPFGDYAKTYGVFAGIVVLLFWLWLSMYAILLGAEINAESEQQTVQDTTKGEEKPLGERGAVKADSVPSGDPEARTVR
jgi:membrane protein